MKIKFFLVVCALCTLYVPAFSEEEDSVHFGFNYSPTFSQGDVRHVIGGHVALLGDRDDWFRKYYVAFGFDVDITKDGERLMESLEVLGVKNLDYKFFMIPFRVGYPFFVRFNDSASLNIIPSLAVDFQIPYCKFSQTIERKKVSCELYGFGFSLGFSADIGMQHRFGAFQLRYGVDVEVPFVTMLICNIKMTGAVNASASASSIKYISDAFALTLSPYLSIGFEF